MNILVCISAVPDTTTKITFTENNTKFDTNGVQFIINPYDELALTHALTLTEQHGGEVHIVTVGEASVDPIIRKGLAIGAAKAFRINAHPTDGMEVAKEIAALAEGKGYGLVFTGRESIDYNSGQVAPLLSEMLGYSLANVVTELTVEGDKFIATRDIDGGREVIECSMPCVASAQKDLCEPRIPNMRGIMQARTKPLEVVEPTNSGNSTSFKEYALPPSKGDVKLIDPSNAGQLIDLLRDEQKLI